MRLKFIEMSQADRIRQYQRFVSTPNLNMQKCVAKNKLES